MYWLFFQIRFHWLAEVLVRYEHLHRPLSLTVLQSLSLSCASLKCNHLLCIWGCDPQSLSLHKHSEWVCLPPSIHVSCRQHRWILICLVHIQSLWLARLTAKKISLFPLLLVWAVVNQGPVPLIAHVGILRSSLVVFCFSCVWWISGLRGGFSRSSLWL